MSETMAEANRFAYQGTALECHACREKDEAWHDYAGQRGVSTAGLKPIAERRS